MSAALHPAAAADANRETQGSHRHLFVGTLLQFGLRLVLIVFVAVTLLLEPPNRYGWICAVVFFGYVAVIACWSAWALRTGSRSALANRRLVTLVVLGADVAVLSVLSVMTGVTSPEAWTSYVMRDGLFLIPLIAAAQLDPLISGVMAIPTVAAFFATSSVTQWINEEPWATILLTTTVLTALAVGSVVLSRVQRAETHMIADLADQRTQLLQELLVMEKREQQAISERLHDGALQYVLVARRDMEEVRTGSSNAADRVDSALSECSVLLRDVVRELHPEVLARSGLNAAITTLAENLSARSGIVIEVNAATWPTDHRTELDYVLYGAARETLTNAVKHAEATTIWVDLEQHDEWATLRISDDGVGIDEERLARALEDGHIGMASTRMKVLAAGGRFDVRPTSPGTEVTVAIPLGAIHSDVLTASVSA